MKKQELPPSSVLNDLLRYEPETGRLFWKPREVDLFVEGSQRIERRAAIWNSRYAHKEAFTASNHLGYKRGSIFKQSLLAHRVIWKIVSGMDPDEVDHIDGNPANNTWVNLRNVSRTENFHNRAMDGRNNSGALGVCRGRRGRWRAYAWDGSKCVWLGEFDDKADAISARKDWERKADYHPNHSRAPMS